MRRPLRTQSRRGGIATLEAALVLPLILLLMMGLIEYGWMFLQLQQVTNAARQGARRGVVIDTTNAEVEQAIDFLMARAGLGDSGYDVTFLPANVQGLSGREPFTITVEVLYENIGLGLPLVPTPAHLRASVTMASER